MAEILITGIDFPEYCLESDGEGFKPEHKIVKICPFIDLCRHRFGGNINVLNVHSEACPLVELPPHGRLIDADELPVSYPLVVNAQTVIPSSDDYDETIDCTTCKNYEGCEVLIDEDEPIVGCTGFERK